MHYFIRLEIDESSCDEANNWRAKINTDPRVRNEAVHVTLFRSEHPARGTIRIEEFIEGIQLWVGGEMVWKSYDQPAQSKSSTDDCGNKVSEIIKAVAMRPGICAVEVTELVGAISQTTRVEFR